MAAYGHLLEMNGAFDEKQSDAKLYCVTVRHVVCDQDFLGRGVQLPATLR
jgi:hypothetical protein